MDKPDESLPELKLPVEPMLAQLRREMPSGGGWLYEPKWDGFRTLVFWDAEQLVLQSRDLDRRARLEQAWGGRFRHRTTFLRWRPDKPPEQCTFEQLTFAVPIELAEIFGLGGARLA
jgi:ATP-dependent DNA ligase